MQLLSGRIALDEPAARWEIAARNAASGVTAAALVPPITRLSSPDLSVLDQVREGLRSQDITADRALTALPERLSDVLGIAADPLDGGLMRLVADTSVVLQQLDEDEAELAAELPKLPG